MPKLCFVSMVKNESRIIERCLRAVRPHIDYWVILDTGSTDDTKERIRAALAGIPGELHEAEFVDFAVSRTQLMRLAHGKADYLLLGDADEEYQFSEGFSVDALTHDQHLIRYTGGLDYRASKLVRGAVAWYFKGVTHEFITSDAPITATNIDTLTIQDYYDGGCKADKFARDIRLLTQGLVDEPDNARYRFYLAESYKNSKQHAEAVHWYAQRIEAGGWREEVTCSYERLGECYQALGKHADAFAAWMAGYFYDSSRAECLYLAARHARVHSCDYSCAYHLGKLAKAIPYPKDDILFIKRDVYDFLIDYELSVSTFYVNPSEDMTDVFKNILDKLPGMHSNIIANYKWYCKPVDSTVTRSVGVDAIVGHIEGYNNSSPSLVRLPDGNYLLNVRRVSYSLTDNGDYRFVGAATAFNTINTLVRLDPQLRPLDEPITVYPEDLDSRAVTGIEDLRLHVTTSGSVIYTGSVWKAYGEIEIVTGTVDPITKTLSAPVGVPSPTGARCEKNWCLFEHDGATNVVYAWAPLQLFDLDTTGLSNPRVQERKLRHFRGSSPGAVYGDSIYFVTHVVEYAKPRHYYHSIVELDRHTLAYKNHSKLFTFEGCSIEFCLGLVVEDDRVIMTYSTWDRTSHLKVYNRRALFGLIGLSDVPLRAPMRVKTEHGQQCRFDPTTGVKLFNSASICGKAYRRQCEAAKLGVAPPVIRRINDYSYQTAVADTEPFKRLFKNIHGYVHEMFPDLVRTLAPLFAEDGDPKHPHRVDVTPTNLGIYAGKVVLVDFG